MWLSRTIQQLFGIAISAVQKIEIAGVKLEIDTAVVDKVKKCLGGSLGKLMKEAKVQYDKMASQLLVEERLAEVVRVGLREVLAQRGFATGPMTFGPLFTCPTSFSKITCINWLIIIRMPIVKGLRGDAFLNDLA